MNEGIRDLLHRIAGHQAARGIADDSMTRRPHVPVYHGNMAKQEVESIEVDRVQTGIRIERRILKVLKATAELKDMSVGDLLEGIVLHAFEGKSAFSPETLKQIGEFRKIYGLTLRASDSHHLKETGKQPARKA